jgi:hypothetical protein
MTGWWWCTKARHDMKAKGKRQKAKVGAAIWLVLVLVAVAGALFAPAAVIPSEDLIVRVGPRPQRVVWPGYPNSGVPLPHLLQEDLALILTENGDYLSLEGPDNPNVVSLPLTIWYDAQALVNTIQPNAPVDGWRNLGTLGGVVNNHAATNAYALLSTDGACAFRSVADPDNHLDTVPAAIWPAFPMIGDRHGMSVFIVADLSVAGSLFFCDQTCEIYVTYHEAPVWARLNVTDAFGTTITPDEVVGGYPTGKYLVEYRIRYDAGPNTWHQGFYVNGLILGVADTADHQVPPLDRGMYELTAGYLGKLWELRVYGDSLSDTDQLSVRRELSAKHGILYTGDL